MYTNIIGLTGNTYDGSQASTDFCYLLLGPEVQGRRRRKTCLNMVTGMTGMTGMAVMTVVATQAQVIATWISMRFRVKNPPSKFTWTDRMEELPVTTAIQNIKSRHTHDIGIAIPDERQFLKTWRRSLHELVTSQNSKLLEFLVSNGSADPELSRRCSDVLAKYSKPAWSFTSSTRDLSLPVEPVVDAATSWVEGEIGVEPALLREQMRKTIRLYTNTASALAAAEGRLQEKLGRLEAVAGRVNDLMFLESSPELAGLTGPAQAYLDSVYSKLNLEAEYREVMEQHARFTLLRGLVSLGGFQRNGTAAPTCTICMVREVSHAVTPCGHTFCDECCSKQLTGCFICRVQIRDRMRLYYS